jgi:hypothetical protein
MSFQDYEQFDERECARFEEQFAYWDDLTWGFYIYGAYKQSQNNSDQSKETSDTSHFAALLTKLHAYVSSDCTSRYSNVPSYIRLIDSQRSLQKA